MQQPASSLTFRTDLPATVRQLAERAIRQQEERQRRADESRHRKADALAGDLRRHLQDLLGAKGFAELREGIRRERLVFCDLWQPPEGLEHDYGRQRKASQRKIDALVRKLGARPEKLREVRAPFQDRLEDILAGVGKVVPGYHLTRNLDAWMKLSPLHRFPLPWGTRVPDLDPPDPHRWFLFRPPFFGFLFRFLPQTHDNFRLDRRLFLDPSAGLVGNEVTMDCDDAGDIELAWATAEAQIAFGFEAPIAGVMEVLIDAQSTVGSHHVDFEDEFGFSDASCNQDNFLMMNVLHPNVTEPSLAGMSKFVSKSDGDDKHDFRENLARGQHFFAQLFSSGPVPAGHTIVTVGTRNFDRALTNDMEVHSVSNFQWFINSVEVRIAP
jgi:hypothetical protein